MREGVPQFLIPKLEAMRADGASDEELAAEARTSVDYIQAVLPSAKKRGRPPKAEDE